MFRKPTTFRSIGIAAAGLTCGALPLAAQAIDGPQTADFMMVAALDECAPLPDPVAVAVEPRAETFKSKPYSGVGTTEVITTLADGNRITRTNTMKYYRDSAGRTRTEYQLAAIGPFTPDQAQTVVTIYDPVQQTRYVLHSAVKRADVFKMKDGGGLPKQATLSKGERNLTFVTKSIGGATTVTSVPALTGPGPGGEAGAVAMLPPVMLTSTAPMPPPANAGFFMQYMPPPSLSTEGGCKANTKPLPAPTSLGERTIEGLKVTGNRMEFTIPAGQVGNELPIVVHSEQWFSPELGVVVSSAHHDPLMGDTNYRLEAISRTEPDAALFTVPADYTKNDVAAGRGAFFEGPPGAPVGGGVQIRGGAVTSPKPADR